LIEESYPGPFLFLSRSYFVLYESYLSYFCPIFLGLFQLFPTFSIFFAFFYFFVYGVIKLKILYRETEHANNILNSIKIKKNDFFRIFYVQDSFLKMRIGHFWMSIFDFKKKVSKVFFHRLFFSKNLIQVLFCSYPGPILSYTNLICPIFVLFFLSLSNFFQLFPTFWVFCLCSQWFDFAWIVWRIMITNVLKNVKYKKWFF
jgi:hypothetical protein